jgi:hypothetical protein
LVNTILRRNRGHALAGNRPSGCDLRKVTSTWGTHAIEHDDLAVEVILRRTVTLGNSGGKTGWDCPARVQVSRPYPRRSSRAIPFRWKSPFRLTTLAKPSRVRFTRLARRALKCVHSGRAKIVTWLILPVVICLSQRLSHACLSISNYTVKLRMAH